MTRGGLIWQQDSTPLDPYRGQSTQDPVTLEFIVTAPRWKKIDNASYDAAVKNLFGGDSPRDYSFGSNLPYSSYASGGQVLSSHDPTVFQNYRTAVRQRQQSASEMWNAGWLGYVAGPVEWVLSPLTGASDVSHSYVHGREGWIGPADSQATDIVGFAAGGMRSVAGKLGAVSAAETNFAKLPPAIDLSAGGLSSANAWTKAARLRAAGSGIGLPSKEGYLRFVPDARWNPERALPRGRAGGYLDRHGNEWLPDLVKGEWDVQLGRSGQRQLGHLSKNGRYLNVTPDGRISH